MPTIHDCQRWYDHLLPEDFEREEEDESEPVPEPDYEGLVREQEEARWQK